MSHYYHFKMIMCRERTDTAAVGAKTYSEPSRTVYSYEFEDDTVDATAAEGLAAFVAAVAADIPTNAPDHMKVSYTAGGLGAALLLSLGSSQDDASTASEGPWSLRVGKDVFRYEIGYSATSAAAATSALTAKNLS